MSITDFKDISKDELDNLKKQMIENESKILYSDKKLECKLMKIKGKVYEIIYTYGDIEFKDIFNNMIKIRYAN
jgi:hypothetical protein